MNRQEKTFQYQISIVMPTYNRGNIISKSIESVLNQTYKNIELIVVDDHSTDNTEEIIKEYKDKRLKYIKLPKNYGACYARNIGIKKSTGDYIAFQDSDDIFAKNKLEEQIANLLKKDSDLDFCKIRINAHNFKSIIPNHKQEIELKNKKIIDLLCTGNFISTQAILAKRKIFNELSFNHELPRLQDYDLVLRISQKYKISHTQKILVDLYRQDDSISKSKDKLLEACSIILTTDYGLNNQQTLSLTKTLLHYVEGSVKEECDELYLKLSHDYHNLEKQNNALLKENQQIYTDLQSILNSKGWRTLEKLRKITSCRVKLTS